MEHKFFIVIEFGNFSLRLQNNLNILCSINFILKIKIGNGESEWETNAFPIFIELFWVFLYFFYKYFICEMGYVFTILFYIFFFFCWKIIRFEILKFHTLTLLFYQKISIFIAGCGNINALHANMTNLHICFGFVYISIFFVYK